MGQPLDFVAARPPTLLTKGTYTGLFYELDGVHQPSSGFFTLSLTASRAFSGKMLVDGGAYGFSGRFDTNNQAQFQVARSRKSPLLVRLQIDSTVPEVYGTVTDGNWLAELSADHAFSSSGNPATNYVGVYNLSIPGDDDSGDCFLGDGFASLTIDFNGAIHLSGELADGTRFSQASHVSQNGQCPLYVSLYAGKGSLVSWLTFSNFPSSTLGGDLIWIKPAIVSSKFYAAGLTNQTLAVGSSFIGPIPSHGHQQLSFNNAVVTLQGGNLPAPITYTVGSSNSASATGALSLKWDSISGLVRGSFLHPATGKTTPIHGVLLQSQAVARGYFLGVNQSGSFTLQQQPED
jgi:hypothetical protein